MTADRGDRFWPYALLLPFFLSGAAALTAQLCWLRTLTVTLGGSAGALNIILITFMGGLALGAALSKRVCTRVRHYVLLYAGLEAVLSIYLLISSDVIAMAGREFIRILPSIGHETVTVQFVRLVVAGSAMLLPTVVMGMTTPVLITATVRRFRETASKAGLLYGINTLGAAAGALFAGCYLILEVGVRRSLEVASLLNFIAALIASLIAWRLFRVPEEQEDPPIDTSPVSDSGRREAIVLCMLAAGGGFAGMGLEVIFARFLSFVIGGSYYSHTISIGGFLLGIVAGSLAIGLLTARHEPRARLLPFLFCGLGLATIVSMLLFEQLPVMLGSLFSSAAFFRSHFVVSKLTATLLLVLLPAMASGLVLPYLIHLLTRRIHSVTTASANVLFYNTIGSVFGVATTGYFLIEMIGVRNSLLVITLLVFGLALVSLFTLTDGARRPRAVATALAVAGIAVVLVLIPLRGSRPLIVDSRVYEQLGRPDVIYYEEDETASVSVVEYADRNARALLINGLLAGEADHEHLVEGVIADIALLAHPDPRTFFIAGLGSGRTAGIAGLYPRVATEVVEISPAVISALPFFDDYTFRVHENNAVDIRHGDARHFLQTTDKRYDLIAPDVYVSALTGTAYLYNVEFFRLCAARLNPGGRVILNIYLQTEIDRVIASSFVAAFPHVSLVEVPYSSYAFLVGGNEPIVFPEKPWSKWSDNPAVVERAKQLGVTRRKGLGDFVVATKQGLLRRLAGSRISTDDHPIVDFLQVANAADAMGW